MKKLLSLFLALLLLPVSAHALTIGQFAERFNADVDKGFHAALWKEYIMDDVWFLSGSDQRNIVAVVFDPSSAEKPEDCIVKSIALKHKPRVSVAVFINNIGAALAAAYPDIPEDERLAEAMRCLRIGDQVFGLGYFQDDPIPYNTAHMGQFVYQEALDYHTFLFSIPADRP